MDSCPYYYEEVRITGTKQDVTPCCRHKHTPVPCFTPTLLTETPHVLKCGGRLSRCEIPAYKQLDVS